MKAKQIQNCVTDRMAHYRIIRKLGQGGMSIVYEALDEKLKRPVAIKLLHPFFSDNAEYRARFLREAMAVARLAHPNIVQIFDAASADAKDKQVYLVTELLHGETLKDFAKRLNLIELPELSALIIWQIAQALEHAHEKGIIHRDLKPENIMVCKSGQLKLMDFGIATLGGEESLTQTGGLLGSLGHLSPELIKGQKATAQSDIFSLCTVFYWMLTQKLPFVADSPHALLSAIVDTPHQKIQRLSAYISDDLADIVDTGMQKDPKSRHKSMANLASAIETALLKMGVSIDIKEMQALLKEPKLRFSTFKNFIYDQISNKHKLLALERNDTRALALACRLEAGGISGRSESSKNKLSAKHLGLALIAIVGLFVLATGLSRYFFKPLSAPISISEDVQAKLTEVFFEPNSPPQHQQEVLPKSEQKVSANAALREVNIVVWPFANITVDGKLFGTNAKSLSLKLAPGRHKLIFTHSYAAAVEKHIVVSDEHKPLEISVQLVKTKPAFLRVRANTDADVAIDGHFKGGAAKSLSRPIVVPLPDKTHGETKEVLISKPGHQPILTNIQFIAGQTHDLEITLKKVSDSD